MSAKQVLPILLLLIVVCGAYAYDWNTNPGTGTEADPYQISEPNHLLAINDIDTTGVYFILTHDIDLDPNLPGNRVFTQSPVDSMKGTLNGNNHSIQNLTIDQDEPANSGLFQIIEKSGCVTNLQIEGVSIKAHGPYFGALAGDNYGKIINCHTSGYLEGGLHWIGGLVGRNDDWNNSTALIANSSSVCTISGTPISNIGGLAGYNRASVFQSCYSGLINTPESSGVGGLIGKNDGLVNRCFANTQMHAGSGSGFAASNNGLIRDCFAIGTAESLFPEQTAGLAEINEIEYDSLRSFSRIENCYAVLQITDSVHGLVGPTYNVPGAVLSSFWDMDVSGTTQSFGGTGLSTAQMKDPNTYINAGWDIAGETANGAEDVWRLDPNINNGYPSLVFKPLDGGDGTPANPYIIYTKQQLLDFFNDTAMWDKHIKLIANIDLSDREFTSALIETFTGTFDGSGCAIYGLTSTSLFDTIGRDGVIKNLWVKDAEITKNGCIIAALNLGQIIDCHVHGAVGGGEYAGGLVSINDGRIYRCSADCQVSSSSDMSTGGLVGLNSNTGVVRQSCSNGSVDGPAYAGGLVGWNWGKIEHSYSKASVAGSSLSGALVGSNELGVVICCYATGAVPGDKLIGFNGLGVVAHSYLGGYIEFPEAWEGNSWYEDDGHIWTTNEIHPGQLLLKWQSWGPPVSFENIPYYRIPGYRQDPSRDGSAEHPYRFSFELSNYPADWDKHFILTDDVDLAWDGPPVFNQPPIPYFNGTLDGGGHVIRNLWLENLTELTAIGFFGVLGHQAVVKQLGIEGELDYFDRYPALFAGISFGTLKECYAKGSVTCDTYGGILTGFNGGTIRDCYAEGTLTLDHILTEPWDETPIVGGGLYARSWGRVINSYASVDTVYPGDYIYSGVGGLNEGLVWNSYWNKDLTDPNFMLGGSPLTTEQMRDADSFIGWGDGTWKIADGNDTPRLMWENTDWVWTPENPEPPDCWWEDNCPEYLPIVDLPRSYSGGDGTAASPYRLSTAEDLFTLGRHPADCDKHFVLDDDINLSGQTLPKSVIGYFTGNFNGAGYTVSGLSITAFHSPGVPGDYYHTYTSGIGLFGCIDTGGAVENLALENVNIDGMCTVGALAGENNGTIRRSYVTGAVTAHGNIGGLVGSNGFRRPYGDARIEDCYTDTSLVGDALQGFAVKYIGGVAGANGGSIRRCFAAGTIDTNQWIWEYTPFITGGIAGWSAGGDVSDGYYSGTGGENPVGTQLDATQMKQQGSFAGWDFVGDDNGNRDLWRLCTDGVETPRLSWEFSAAGDFACPAGVNLRDFAALAANWLTDEAADPAGFNVACDANLDRQIDIADVLVLAENWLN